MASFTPTQQTVRSSIENKTPLTAKEIRGRREKCNQTIMAFKLCFWITIGLLNVLIWAPLPFTINTAIIITTAVFFVIFACIVPIVGIKRQQRVLEALEDCSPGPKKRRASEAGKVYIEKVKKEGRSFIRAEVELLDERSGPAGTDAE